MTQGMRALLAVISIGILTAAWIARLEISSAGQLGVYVLDRWTGTVYTCSSGQCLVLYSRPLFGSK